MTKLLLVLLRVAIGWHLFYEGIHKLQSMNSDRPWSAEGYLRNASGPGRDYFRNLVDDVYSREALRPESVLASWRADQKRLADYYHFNSEQSAAADKKLKELSNRVKEHFESDDNKKKIKDYFADLDAWLQADTQPMVQSAADAHKKTQLKLEATRRELVAPVQALTAELSKTIDDLRTAEQAKMAKPVLPWQERPQLDKVNLITMYGLTILGGCMMLGLFSRLSCLGSACLLALFYAAMPPWPGLPVNPMAEGSYLYVNKNLIEIIACLMLATTSSGAWGGLDALIRGLITRPLFGVGAREVRDQFDQKR